MSRRVLSPFLVTAFLSSAERPDAFCGLYPGAGFAAAFFLVRSSDADFVFSPASLRLRSKYALRCASFALNAAEPRSFSGCCSRAERGFCVPMSLRSLY
jgi:hypothetical protein